MSCVPGDDLVAAIADHAPRLQDGDVLVVTSKVVSKVEGRLVAVDNADPAARDAARMAAIDAETDRVVAQRGELKIVQTRQGLVLAAAGVDESNVAADELALLPVEPDGSAAALREGLHERLGVDVGVIVSDSMGRPWRNGIVDQAIGVAGLRAVFDARGRLDSYGRPLLVTEVAVADEIAAAADLVKGKLSGVPVAIVRGLATDGKLVDDGLGISTLLRDSTDDLFRLGTTEAIEVGRADAVGSRVSPPALHRAAVEAITAFVPPTLAEGSVREAFLGFLSARPDAMWRSCVAGHVTASALILDPVRRSVLLTLHPRAGMWLQVGGHCDPDDITLLDAARREAAEESGIADLGSIRYCSAWTCTRSPARSACPPGISTCGSSPSLRRAPCRCAATSRSTWAGSPGTRCPTERHPSCPQAARAAHSERVSASDHARRSTR